MRVDALAAGEDRRIRSRAAAGSLLFHAVAALILSFLVVSHPAPPPLIELDWGGSGGGTGETFTFSPSPPAEAAHQPAPGQKKDVSLPKMSSAADEALPAARKKTTRAKALAAAPVTSQVRRHTRASGSGGGSGGGAGKSTGYSIDWSGAGSRKLLSGRIPQYPEGTDKEMPVMLQFTVLPDGSVSAVIPLRRSDELLEREASSALRTWRFDPLPPQYEQKPQMGKITFIFKLER